MNEEIHARTVQKPGGISPERQHALSTLAAVAIAKLRTSQKAIALEMLRLRANGNATGGITDAELKAQTKRLADFLSGRKELESSQYQTLKDLLRAKILHARPSDPIHRDISQLSAIVSLLYGSTLELTFEDDRRARDQEFMRALGLDPTDVNVHSLHRKIGGAWLVARYSTEAFDERNPLYNLSLLNVTPVVHDRLVHGKPQRVKNGTSHFSLRSRHHNAADGEKQSLQIYRGLVLPDHHDINFIGQGSQTSKHLSMIWLGPERIDARQAHGVHAHGIITTGNADDQSVCGPIEASWVLRTREVHDEEIKIEAPDAATMVRWAKDIEKIIHELEPAVGRYDEEGLRKILKKECGDAAPELVIQGLKKARKQIQESANPGYYRVRR